MRITQTDIIKAARIMHYGVWDYSSEVEIPDSTLRAAHQWALAFELATEASR